MKCWTPTTAHGLASAAVLLAMATSLVYSAALPNELLFSILAKASSFAEQFGHAQVCSLWKQDIINTRIDRHQKAIKALEALQDKPLHGLKDAEADQILEDTYSLFEGLIEPTFIKYIHDRLADYSKDKQGQSRPPHHSPLADALTHQHPDIRAGWAVFQPELARIHAGARTVTLDSLDSSDPNMAQAFFPLQYLTRPDHTNHLQALIHYSRSLAFQQALYRRLKISPQLIPLSYPPFAELLTALPLVQIGWITAPIRPTASQQVELALKDYYGDALLYTTLLPLARTGGWADWVRHQEMFIGLPSLMHPTARYALTVAALYRNESLVRDLGTRLKENHPYVLAQTIACMDHRGWRKAAYSLRVLKPDLSPADPQRCSDGFFNRGAIDLDHNGQLVYRFYISNSEVVAYDLPSDW
ncbi:hypothetical protein BJ085DRAFT_37521 [Dimargaris cristalligena]|uniref:Uncharacterized protein n=1 Tax=Dimargaris cristalligena TaxID=215637 RepID=A0A4Q0A2Q4_9FUNG|nr:hypothetical protein BJ085DRAFT_37521 [Dimargaris cristalligena]|eukprot:RKP39470.1 hypothetical protein BJ085DRAFT_37521 [Dimargaris cristalligena]